MKSRTKISHTSSQRKRGSLSKISRSAKRYGKQTLRDILLSKTFHSSFKILIGLMVTGSALYGAYAFIGTTFADDIVVSKSEILSRVSRHINLPLGEPEAVVRVQDSSTLKKQNTLFENAKEGDYIVMYQDLAVVYDLRNDAIIALKRMNR